MLRNCDSHGDCIKRRDWCLLRMRTPALLTLRVWREERRPTYLFGRSEGNPTHVTCLHMLPLLRWMELADIPLGQVGLLSGRATLCARLVHNLIINCASPADCCHVLLLSTTRSCRGC